MRKIKQRRPRRIHVERLESRALLAAGIDAAFYEFTNHNPGAGSIDLGSSDLDAATTASEIQSPLFLNGTGNGSPPRGLALGSVFDATTEPTPAGGEDDYIEFTVSPHGRRNLSYSTLSFQARRNDPNSKDSFSVYYDNIPDAGGDNFQSRLLRTRITSEDVFETIEIDLENVGGLTNQRFPITFRIYTWGTTGTSAARLDNIRLQTRQAAINQSEMAYYGDSGRLVLPLDNQGDRLPDFSTAGYKNGNEPIPDVASSVGAARIVDVSPIAGDNTAHIQAAIDQVAEFALDADGFRGVVQLGVGEFPISGQLRILESGIVLRGTGDGDNPAVDTILRGTGTSRRTLVVVGKTQVFQVKFLGRRPV